MKSRPRSRTNTARAHPAIVMVSNTTAEQLDEVCGEQGVRSDIWYKWEAFQEACIVLSHRHSYFYTQMKSFHYVTATMIKGRGTRDTDKLRDHLQQ